MRGSSRLVLLAIFVFLIFVVDVRIQSAKAASDFAGYKFTNSNSSQDAENAISAEIAGVARNSDDGDVEITNIDAQALCFGDVLASLDKQSGDFVAGSDTEDDDDVLVSKSEPAFVLDTGQSENFDLGIDYISTNFDSVFALQTLSTP